MVCFEIFLYLFQKGAVFVLMALALCCLCIDRLFSIEYKLLFWLDSSIYMWGNLWRYKSMSFQFNRSKFLHQKLAVCKYRKSLYGSYQHWAGNDQSTIWSIFSWDRLLTWALIPECSSVEPIPSYSTAGSTSARIPLKYCLLIIIFNTTSVQ